MVITVNAAVALFAGLYITGYEGKPSWTFLPEHRSDDARYRSLLSLASLYNNP